MVDETNVRKAKGVKKNVVKKQIKHEQYKQVLFSKEQMWHGMNMLRSEGHEIYGMHVNKISLSPFDSKRWIADDGVNTKAYGYNNQMEEMEALFANGVRNGRNRINKYRNGRNRRSFKVARVVIVC